MAQCSAVLCVQLLNHLQNVCQIFLCAGLTLDKSAHLILIFSVLALCLIDLKSSRLQWLLNKCWALISFCCAVSVSTTCPHTSPCHFLSLKKWSTTQCSYSWEVLLSKPPGIPLTLVFAQQQWEPRCPAHRAELASVTVQTQGVPPVSSSYLSGTHLPWNGVVMCFSLIPNPLQSGWNLASYSSVFSGLLGWAGTQQGPAKVAPVPERSRV